MNIVDSSGWLEFFADGPNAEFFAPVIQQPEELIVPSITVYEVFKRVLQQKGESHALSAVATMTQSTVVDLDTAIALNAAKASVETKLPMADSVILATARYCDAVLWTQDADFEGMEGIRYVSGR